MGNPDKKKRFHYHDDDKRDYRFREYYDYYDEHIRIQEIWARIRNNKKLLKFLIITGTLIFVIGAITLIISAPLISKFFSNFENGELKRLFNTIAPFLKLLVNGDIG